MKPVDHWHLMRQFVAGFLWVNAFSRNKAVYATTKSGVTVWTVVLLLKALVWTLVLVLKNEAFGHVTAQTAQMSKPEKAPVLCFGEV